MKATQPNSARPPQARYRLAGVFEGGGAKGLAYVGALEAVLERDCWFSAVAGASAGAITAALVAAGLTPDEIRAQTPIALGKLQATRFRGLRRLRREGGYFPKQELIEWLEDLLSQQVEKLRGPHLRPVTFATLFNATGIELNVIAANLSLRQQTVFSTWDTPFCEVADAVVASCSIPFAFPPSDLAAMESDSEATETGQHKRQQGQSGKYFAQTIVDGGVWANFPMFVFTDETFRRACARPPKPPQDFVVGFLLDDDSADEGASPLLMRFNRAMQYVRNDPWERRRDRYDPRGWRDWILRGAFLPVALLTNLGTASPFGSGPATGHWPRPARGLARHVIDALDGTVLTLARPVIGFAVWAFLAASVAYSLRAFIDVLPSGVTGPLALWIILPVLAGTALVVLVMLGAVLFNIVMLPALRQVLYGLAQTYVMASGAPRWAKDRDDVISLPIPLPLQVLSFDLLEKDPAVVECAIAQAKAVTLARLDTMLARAPALAVWRALEAGLRGELDDARAVLDAAIKGRQQKLVPWAAFALGMVLERARDLETARAAFRRAVETGDADVAPAARARLVRLDYEVGDIEEAIRQSKAAKQDADVHARSTLLLQVALFWQQYAEGPTFHDALRRVLESGDPFCSFRAAVHLALSGDGDAQTRSALQAGINEDALWTEMSPALLPGLYEPLKAIAGISLRQTLFFKLLPYAVSHTKGLEQLLLLQRIVSSADPDLSPLACLHLGIVQRDRGKSDSACDLFRQAADSRHPDAAPEGSLRLAMLLREKGDEDGADAAFEVAIASGHPYAAPAAAARLALRRFEQGRPEEARQVLNRVASSTRNLMLGDFDLQRV